MRSISSLSEASFCEGVESGHSSHSQQAAIAAALGITNPPVKMDSQAKYATIARGVADIYLRLPVSADYEEKIWVCLSSQLPVVSMFKLIQRGAQDHAVGSLIVEEAGGIVSDINGNQLNFSIGRTLKDNKGIVAATANIHKRVIKAVQDELKGSLL